MSTIEVPEITDTGHIIGKTYFSTYWRLRYTVEGHGVGAHGRPYGVVTRWEDGTRTAHATAKGNDPLAMPFD